MDKKASLLVLIPVLAVVGCGAGISLSPSGSSVTESAGGLPGSPAGITLLSGGGASTGSGIVTGSSLTVLVRTGSTSFQGQSEGEGVRLADPFFEAGIDEVVRRTTEE